MTFEDIAYSRNHIISFLHVGSGREVSFPAFIRTFSDSYNVNWQPVEIFGRTDPVQNYQSTRRSINISFDVVSDSLSTAKRNMEKYALLKRMLYPVYSEPLSAGYVGTPGAKGRTIKAPPYIRLKFMNYIENISDSSFEEGLLGCIKGFKFDPDIAKNGTFIDEDNKLLPKYFTVTFQFDPQHEETLGWGMDSQFLSSKFPYRAGSERLSEQAARTTNEDVRRTNEKSVLDGGDS